MPRSGNTTERGYGNEHQALRARVRDKIAEQGGAQCWRCRQVITPWEPWDLGHDDHDRGVYRGPEHRACNRSAGARKTNRRRSRRAVDRDW